MDSITDFTSPDWQEQALAEYNRAKAENEVGYRYRNTVDDFSTADLPERERYEELKAKANAWIESFSKHSNSLYLYSAKPGSGKTHMACYILAGVIKRRFTGKLWSVTDFMSAIKNTYNPDSRETESELISAATEADLLVLDDLGTETVTEWSTDVLYRVINRRYIDVRPVIFTSNASSGDLEKHISNHNGSKIVSRMCEMVEPAWRFPEQDLRPIMRKGK